MAIFTVSIDSGNAAFAADGEAGSEIARILIELASRIADDGAIIEGDPYWLWDINGNNVGRAILGEEGC